jgi:hypothetical protein
LIPLPFPAVNHEKEAKPPGFCTLLARAVEIRFKTAETSGSLPTESGARNAHNDETGPFPGALAGGKATPSQKVNAYNGLFSPSEPTGRIRPTFPIWLQHL